MRRRCIVAFTAIFLGGCATTYAPTSVSPAVALARWHYQKHVVGRITRFTLDAQVGASGSFGMSGSLHWIQDGQSFQLHLSGPFDTDAITVTGTRAETIIRSASHTIKTTKPEAYLFRHFRWTLPIAGLRYWALGLPLPDTPAILRYNSNGTLRYLHQDGWTIQYQSYQNVGGYILPMRFRADAKHTEFRIDIYRWTAISPPATQK